MDESGGGLRRQIDLGHVARDDHLGIDAEAGEEHFDLMLGGVLRLVEDDDGVAQRAAAHEGQRGDLDHVVLHVFAQAGRGDHLLEGVVEGLEIGVELVFHLAGQEAEFLAGLYGGSAEDDLAHLLVLQCAHGQGDGDEGLARSGGPDGEGEVVLLEAIDEQLLIGRAGGDGATIDAIDDQVILRYGRQLVALD